MVHQIRSTPVSYDVMEYLGEGLNGTVYKAVRSDPFRHVQQTVALKILKSKNLVKIWRHEFESLASVQSRNCVRVFGFEWVGDRPALILEFVDGTSLRQLCLAEAMEEALATEILAQIQAGLLSLHAQRLSHGDLSPNNVMIDRNGWVKLVDFGAANLRQATPAFAAPELLDGAIPTLASDLFSLGKLEQLLLQRTSRRLSDNPADRQPMDESSQALRRDLLAKRVCRWLDQQALTRNVATRIMQPARTSKFSICNLLLALTLVTQAPGAQARSHVSGQEALLRIRSHSWLRLSVDGTDLGFAPLDVLLTPAQKHRLAWQSPFRRGLALVQLAAGETKLLMERDL